MQVIILALMAGGLFFLIPAKEIHHPNGFAPVYDLIYNFFKGKIYATKIFTFIIFVLNGFFLSLFLQQYNLANRNSFLPSLVYFLLLASFPFLLELNQISFSSFILIWIITRLNKLETNENYKVQLISLSFLIGLFTMVYFPNIFLILILIFALIIFNKISLAEVSIILSISAIPFIYLFSYYFLIDINIEEWNDLIAKLQYNPLVIYNLKMPHVFIPLIIISLIYILSLLKTLDTLYNNLIEIRRRISLSIYLFFVLLAMSFFSGNFFEYNLMLLLIPMSIIISFFLKDLKNDKWANIGLLVYLIVTIAFNISLKLNLYVA